MSNQIQANKIQMKQTSKRSEFASVSAVDPFSLLSPARLCHSISSKRLTVRVADLLHS